MNFQSNFIKITIKLFVIHRNNKIAQRTTEKQWIRYGVLALLSNVNAIRLEIQSV